MSANKSVTLRVHLPAGVTIKIHHTPEFELGTPGTEEFLKADLSRDHTSVIQKIER